MAEKLEDLNLPNASVLKIVKEAIPENVNLAKDARTALARAASVFILYLTSHSSQVAQKANRKTLLGQDVLDALESLEFEEFIEPLQATFQKFKDAKGKKGKSKKSNEEDDDVTEVLDDEEEEMEQDKDDS